MWLFSYLAARAQNAWLSIRDEESGQTLVEYALIIAVVSIGALVALGLLTGSINDIFNRAGNAINTAS